MVDTGLHTRRWARDQAISYKIGMLNNQELRAKTKAELGESFDIRDFHDEVLHSGAVPLPILEHVVEQYTANVKASDQADDRSLCNAGGTSISAGSPAEQGSPMTRSTAKN